MWFVLSLGRKLYYNVQATNYSSFRKSACLYWKFENSTIRNVIKDTND